MPTDSERRQIAAISRELSGAVERTVRTIAGGVLNSVAESTPKDTGASAASWVIAGRRRNGPVVRRSRRAVAAAKTAQTASAAKLAGYKLAQGPVNVGSAQAGIDRLNDGASTKEPAGFVQRAIRKAVLLARALRP